MNLNSIIFITSMLAICIYTTTKQDFPTAGIDPDLQPYVSEFELCGKKFKANYKVPPLNMGLSGHIGLEPTHENSVIAGVCDTNTRPVTVIINKDIWLTLDSYEREELIFHELGHCFLGRDHLEDEINDTPVSIMFPMIHEAYQYRKYRNEYIEELFTKSARAISLSLNLKGK